MIPPSEHYDKLLQAARRVVLTPMGNCTADTPLARAIFGLAMVLQDIGKLDSTEPEAEPHLQYSIDYDPNEHGYASGQLQVVGQVKDDGELAQMLLEEDQFIDHTFTVAGFELCPETINEEREQDGEFSDAGEPKTTESQVVRALLVYLKRHPGTREFKFEGAMT